MFWNRKPTIDSVLALFSQPHRIADFEKVRALAAAYVPAKQARYSGAEYVDQIEKNAIYLEWSFEAAVDLIASFIEAGTPDISKMSDADVASIASGAELGVKARAAVPTVVAYVHHGSPFLPGFERYSTLRKHFANRDVPEFIDELEVMCTYYQAAFVTAQMTLMSVCRSSSNRAIGRGLPVAEVREAVRAGVLFASNRAIGNVKQG